MYKWTVDIDGGRWGGRKPYNDGMREGLPLILSAFKKFNVKALFFISTELFGDGFMEGYGDIWLKDIIDEAHEIGSHGHFHIVYDNITRKVQDKHLSQMILKEKIGNLYPKYRAPKFSFITSDIYSNPKNHVGLLKYMWGLQRIPKEPIFYLHPFDLEGGKYAPNIFCKLWYSQPKRAYETFISLLSQYH